MTHEHIQLAYATKPIRRRICWSSAILPSVVGAIAGFLFSLVAVFAIEGLVPNHLRFEAKGVFFPLAGIADNVLDRHVTDPTRGELRTVLEFQFIFYGIACGAGLGLGSGRRVLKWIVVIHLVAVVAFFITRALRP